MHLNPYTAPCSWLVTKETTILDLLRSVLTVPGGQFVDTEGHIKMPVSSAGNLDSLLMVSLTKDWYWSNFETSRIPITIKSKLLHIHCQLCGWWRCFTWLFLFRHEVYSTGNCCENVWNSYVYSFHTVYRFYWMCKHTYPNVFLMHYWEVHIQSVSYTHLTLPTIYSV